MATIFADEEQERQYRNPPPQDQFSQQQSPQANDPLFEALVKYITSGPGPSAITATSIQDIIDSHTSQPGGRDYLNSILGTQQTPDPTVYNQEGRATGYLSTNMTNLTLNFMANSDRPGGPRTLNFRGTSSGFFPPQAVELNGSSFLWHDINDGENVDFTITNQTALNMVTIEFYSSSTAQMTPRIPLGELHIVPGQPTYLPPQVQGGTGRFQVSR